MIKLKYEARYFFKELPHNIFFFQKYVESKISQIDYIIGDDEYYETANRNYLIKKRNLEAIEVKKINSEKVNYKIFEKKIQYDLSTNIEDELSVKVLNKVLIHKKRYKYKLDNSSKLEISKIYVNGKNYYSFCIESKIEEEIEFFIKHFKDYSHNALTLNGKIILCYLEFLQWLGSNDA